MVRLCGVKCPPRRQRILGPGSQKKKTTYASIEPKLSLVKVAGRRWEEGGEGSPCLVADVLGVARRIAPRVRPKQKKNELRDPQVSNPSPLLPTHPVLDVTLHHVSAQNKKSENCSGIELKPPFTHTPGVARHIAPRVAAQNASLGARDRPFANSVGRERDLASL
jgi:hypothetical protein